MLPNRRASLLRTAPIGFGDKRRKRALAPSSEGEGDLTDCSAEWTEVGDCGQGSAKRSRTQNGEKGVKGEKGKGDQGKVKKKGSRKRAVKSTFYWPAPPPGPYLSNTPAQIPHSLGTRRVYSDFFLASKNPYKARIAKFARHAQQDRGKYISSPSAQVSPDDRVNASKNRSGTQSAFASTPLKTMAKDPSSQVTPVKQEKEKGTCKQGDKDRFSFKREGILALSQVIDMFCAGLFHELHHLASPPVVRKGNSPRRDAFPITKPDDTKLALRALGWGSVRLEDLEMPHCKK